MKWNNFTSFHIKYQYPVSDIKILNSYIVKKQSLNKSIRDL